MISRLLDPQKAHSGSRDQQWFAIIATALEQVDHSPQGKEQKNGESVEAVKETNGGNDDGLPDPKYGDIAYDLVGVHFFIVRIKFNVFGYSIIYERNLNISFSTLKEPFH